MSDIQDKKPLFRECFRWLKIFTLNWQNIIEAIFSVTIFILICIVGYIAFLTVVKKGWGSDAAAWAQAAGSIIAIAGAAWVARGEARHERRLRRAQGEEAAWSVRFVIAQAQFDSQIVSAELTSGVPFDSYKIHDWVQRGKLAALSVATLLSRVDHIHAAVIVTTCNAKVLVDQLLADLLELQDNVKRDKPVNDQLVADIVHAHLSLKLLIDQYDDRVRGIRHALDVGNDMLPLKKWGVWTNHPT